MAYSYHDGLGTAGSEAIGDDVSSANQVVYVSTDGDDGNAGTRVAPLLTISAAVSAADPGATIILMEGYTATLTSTITIAEGKRIIGEGGTYGSDPSVELTLNHASNEIFTISGNGVTIENIKFMAAAQSTAGNKIQVTGDGFRCRGCYFAMGELDDANYGIYLTTGCDYATLTDCYFVSTSTTTAPNCGLLADAANLHLVMERCVLDGGTLGFAGQAVAINGSGVQVEAFGMSLLRGANVTMEGADRGAFGIATSTGDSQLSTAW